MRGELVTVRTASRDDVTVLRELYEAMEQELESPRSYWIETEAVPAPIDEALQRYVDEAVVVMGQIDGVSVGFGVAQVRSSVRRSDPIGVIDYLFTEPGARGVGVGEAILSEILQRLRRRGVRHFDAAALPGHRAAKNFFEEHGFKARLIVMHHAE